MFKYRWPGRIINDKGFEVDINHKFFLIYKEGPKKIQIESERVRGETDILIYEETIKTWKTPFENIPIEYVKKKEILENVKAALYFKNIRYEIW